MTAPSRSPANNLFLTSVRTLWELINAGSLAKLKPLIEPYAGGLLWDPVMVGHPGGAELEPAGRFRHPAAAARPPEKAADRLRALARSTRPQSWRRERGVRSAWPRRDRPRHFGYDEADAILRPSIAGEPSDVRLQENCHAQGRARHCPAATSRSAPPATHFVNHHALKGPYPEGSQKAMFGLGCFWGAERKFWELGDGIHVTAVGYAGGLDAQSDL